MSGRGLFPYTLGPESHTEEADTQPPCGHLKVGMTALPVLHQTTIHPASSSSGLSVSERVLRTLVPELPLEVSSRQHSKANY